MTWLLLAIFAVSAIAILLAAVSRSTIRSLISASIITPPRCRDAMNRSDKFNGPIPLLMVSNKSGDNISGNVITRSRGDGALHYYIVGYEISGGEPVHPMLRKLNSLRLYRLHAGLVLVEYTQGAQILYDHLRASLRPAESLFVHEVYSPLLISNARGAEAWMRGERKRDDWR